MSDPLPVAIVAASSTVLGALVGSLASIFGPAWWERKAREQEQARAVVQQRFEAAERYIDALTTLPTAQTYNDTMRVGVARLGFVATLRAGEGVADAFTLNLLERVRENKAKRDPSAFDIIQIGSSMLLAWLRDDLPSERLTDEELTRRLFPGSRAALG